MHLFVQGAPKDQIRRVPSMSWLISHKPSNTNIVFDLGIRQDTHNYPPALYERMQRLVRAEIPQEVFSSLQEANINPRFRYRHGHILPPPLRSHRRSVPAGTRDQIDHRTGSKTFHLRCRDIARKWAFAL
ncbi:hypothetical protein BDV36DRAFT_246687 [Aspergillus pseudocaelatus]|uniref:Uncharacterized protein n=1 Tax=Aspergillus pseudocaelatus TaxID=1825620 RepID=A0ABQ6WXF2_9EURO|nr:hypothetical protein BDV36DRAFT_246687 [Aspergillus pseudocaelatus]